MGLWTSATRALFIRVGDFQSEEVGEELAVLCSQPEDDDLSVGCLNQACMINTEKSSSQLKLDSQSSGGHNYSDCNFTPLPVARIGPSD